MTKPIHTVVLDSNQSWIESLFVTMGRSSRVRLVRVESPPEVLRRRRARQRRVGPDVETQTVVVPGLRRFAGLSQRRVAQAIRRLAQRDPIDLLVCTNPWHAPAIEATPAAVKAYYVTDPFEYFAWPREETLAFEERVLAASDIVIATSVQLADDFRERVSVPVVHVPNAVSQSFLDALDQPLPRPARLGAIKGAIIGVVGQINDSYDWDLIEALSSDLPDVTTVFVGPVMSSETSMARFEAIVERPNVVWVGAQPHAELPTYLATFDVCLNPLRPDDRNDRRSPLRLFDYSATEAPIASTAIREAETLGDQVAIIQSPEHGAAVIRELLDGPAINAAERRAWARRNTWEDRARVWLDLVEEQLGRGGASSEPGTG